MSFEFVEKMRKEIHLFNKIIQQALLNTPKSNERVIDVITAIFVYDI